jgi:hypothetical protein
MSDKGNGTIVPTTKTDAKSEPPARARPIKTLPTERIQITKQLAILRAMAAASGPTGKPVTNKDVADLVEMVESTISISNAFLTDTGLITKTTAGFVPCQDVVNYQRAYEWNPEVAAHKLAPTLRETWFGQKMLTVLSFKTLSEADAVAVLAETAAATKDYQKQIGILVDYLSSAGLIARDNGVVKLGPTAGQTKSDNGKDPEESEPVTPSASPAPIKGSSVETSFAAPTEGTVQFHISVKVDMRQFKKWTPDRIAAFFGGIAQVLAAKGQVEEEASK